MDDVTNRQLLDGWINKRRRQLRIRQWNEVARLADMSPENLRKIRRGEINISEDAADGIEDALQWERGSVEGIVLHGRPPVERTQSSPAADLPDLDAIPDDWTEQEEQRWLVARETLEALKLRANLTRAEWRFMRAKYDQWDAVDQSRKANVTPSDRS